MGPPPGFSAVTSLFNWHWFKNAKTRAHARKQTHIHAISGRESFTDEFSCQPGVELRGEKTVGGGLWIKKCPRTQEIKRDAGTSGRMA